MKVFLLSDELSGRGPVWLNILWPMFRLFGQTFDLVHLPVPPVPPGEGGLPGRLAEVRRRAVWRRAMQAAVRAGIDREGPNLLIVWASSGRNVRWSEELAPVWDLFSHRVVHICDTMLPGDTRAAALARFDLITCFCADLLALYDAVPARKLFWPAHLDTLAYLGLGDRRPIDLIVVGRRDPALHDPLHRHFNSPDGARLFVDFVTRTQAARPCSEEFALLMATYGKSAAAFCYEPSALPRFQNRSPILARWVHAWAAGCTVFGRAPTGTGTAALVDWPEAVIDLPGDPNDAIALVEGVLADTSALAERRRRNVLEAVRRHDTRLRLRDLLAALDLAPPERLRRELNRHAEMVYTLQTRFGM